MQERQFKSEFLPSVSIVIAAYNPGPYLRECLLSIEREILRVRPVLEAYEVILVDDGSSQSLTPYYLGIDLNLTVIRHEANLGRASARNKGVMASKYKIISFIDSDDICPQGRFSALLSPFLQEMDLDCVAGTVVNSEFGADGLLVNFASMSSDILLGSMVISRNAFLKIGFFNPQHKICDYADWFSRFIDAGLHVIQISDPSLIRRIHSTNSSITHPDEYWKTVFSVLRNRTRQIQEAEL